MTTSTKASGEETAPQTEEEFRVSNPWTTRGKIVGVLSSMIAIIVLMGLALVSFRQDKPTASGSVPKTAPARSGTGAARTTVPVTMVSALDFTACKTFKKVALANGNVRLIGSDCGPASASAAQAEVAPEAALAIVRPTAVARIGNAASTPPATEEALTADQAETAVVVESVTEEILEELRGVHGVPSEGAIDATEFNEVTAGTAEEAP